MIQQRQPWMTEKNERGAGGDISLGIDLKAEAIFVSHLRSYGSIDSEEMGCEDDGSSRKIIIDPIDGSDNFISQLPYYGTSVALVENGKTLASIIANLATGELFIKSDQGFRRTSLHALDAITDVPTSLTAAVGLFERVYANPSIAQILYENRIKYRSPGAVALSLAYAHWVDFVLFCGKIRSYDVCAGLHMCEPLHIYEEEELMLVCKDSARFTQLRTLLQTRSDRCA